MSVSIQDIHPDANQIIEDFIQRGLSEDVGEGDHTSQACIPADARSKAHLKVKDVGVIAGVDLARKIFQTVDPDCTFEQKIELTVRLGELVENGIQN